MQASLGLAFSRSKSDIKSTNYNNSVINALNGDIILTSIKDTSIKGANILGQDVAINVGGNLNVESLQDSYIEKTKSFGMNLGGGLGNQSSGSISAGINYSSNSVDRLWSDNQTSIIGSNSVAINVGIKDGDGNYVNNSGNSTIKGAVIANIINSNELQLANKQVNSTTLKDAIDGGGLTFNTKSLTFKNLEDHYYTENSGGNFSTSIGAGINANNQNPLQNLNFYPNGSTTIGIQNHSSRKEQTTFATLGIGTINIADNLDDNENNDSNITNLNRNINQSQLITKDQITGALDVSVTVDNRLLGAIYEVGNNSKDRIENDSTLTREQKDKAIANLSISQLRNEQSNIINNTLTSNQALLETAEAITSPIKEIPVAGTIFYHLSPIEQLAHTFVEKDSKLYFTNIKTGEVKEVTQADLTRNYAVNGIQTDLSKALENYLKNNPELTIRHNPTHGMVGDLLESGLGKIAKALHVPEVIGMNRLVASDMWERRDLAATLNPITGKLENVPVNLFHSQGTIIGEGAMQIYSNLYGTNQDGVESWEDNSNLINQTQRFVAVGPAVSEGDWRDAVKDLGLDKKLNAQWIHDSQDPVLYLTSPTNTIDQIAELLGKPNFNSPIYIPNLIYDIPRGVYHSILHMENHDVKNPLYQEPLK